MRPAIVSIEWVSVSDSGAGEAQRCAWFWLWARLLRPVSEPCHPQPHETEGGRASNERRRGRGVLNEPERLNDTSQPSFESSRAD